jgi:hypothetical protein
MKEIDNKLGQDLFLSLHHKYESEIEQVIATAMVYFNNPTAIGEHPQFLDELDKLLERGAAAEDKLDFLSKFFDPKVAYGKSWT